MIYFNLEVRKNLFAEDVPYEEGTSFHKNSRNYSECISAMKKFFDLFGYDPENDEVEIVVRNDNTSEALALFSNFRCSGFIQFNPLDEILKVL